MSKALYCSSWDVVGSWKLFGYQDRAFLLECLTKSLPEGITTKKLWWLISFQISPHPSVFCTFLTFLLLIWERWIRYGFLLLENVASQDPLSVSVAILHQFNILPEMYQVGYTKLFFRTGQVMNVNFFEVLYNFFLISPESEYLIISMYFLN